MAYEVIILGHLHMPLYFLGTFTEYPYLIISFLMVFVYAIFVVNAYVSIKYEVETIDNDAIINMVYQIFDTGVTVNFICFALNSIIILGLYIKLRRK